ncbi:hypothetical protein [Qipengyuania sphaerica]|uniref:hypothetical protein n=1 Tax=Qipengyuania sphaerica TaxID=2867243 RepID=UPI001C882A5F|nr:hypothetical protein [Qipengyuania sphaerica]MBX7539740.1 hypothetical protein [Qipengyuania sphaerica]
MRKAALALPLAALAVPAHATGGMACSTAGPEPVEIVLGFGHVPSAGLFLARLADAGREIAAEATQWWMQGSEMRLAMVSMETGEAEVTLVADWNEEARAYDGSIWREGKKRWVRCREA